MKLLLGQSLILTDYWTPVVAAIAGTGGGKTWLSFLWLADRMERYPGYGWGYAEPTYQMLAKIILNSPDPERPDLVTFLKGLVCRDGVAFDPILHKSDKIIETKKGLIYLGSADNPDTLQGAAVKGYVLDEGGQMSLIAKQTADQRVAFQEGQVLIPTTPYNRGWLKTEIADKADNINVHVETWKSIDNPRFPKRRYELLKNSMAHHRFSMMFNATFERPEGLIYASFNEEKCIIPRFEIPKEWYVYVGMDFGGVNTAALFIAEKPETGKLYAFREYLQGGLTAKEHAANFFNITEGMNVFKIVGGAASEQQWRDEFIASGRFVEQPTVKAVEVGIDRVIGQHNEDNLYYFDDLALTLDDKRSYARAIDDSGLPIEKIANKERFHLIDAERYIVSELSVRAAFAFD